MVVVRLVELLISYNLADQELPLPGTFTGVSSDLVRSVECGFTKVDEVTRAVAPVKSIEANCPGKCGISKLKNKQNWVKQMALSAYFVQYRAFAKPV